MSKRAEEKAQRAYTDHEGFTFEDERKAYAKGYGQGVKDALDGLWDFIDKNCDWIDGSCKVFMERVKEHIGKQ